MSEHLTNEEIREKLKKLNFDCGPITDTTRGVYLKKLEALKSKSGDLKIDVSEKISDGELRLQLISLGYSPGPITPQNRVSYLKKLEKLRLQGNKSNVDECSLGDSNKNINSLQADEVFYEPMDID